MRIIGGHDYYDSALAYGQDDAIIFMRNGGRRLSNAEVHSALRLPRVICSGYLTEPGAKPTLSDSFRLSNNRHAVRPIQLGRMRHDFHAAHVVLCGRLFNGLHITVREQYGFQRRIEDRWIWSVEALAAYAAGYGLIIHEGRAGTAQDWGWDTANVRYQYDLDVQTFSQWLTPQQLADDARARLLDERITILSNDPSEPVQLESDLVSRPWRVDQSGLGQMQFAKAVDPYTAFQEISMWVGGVLPQSGRPVVEITDDKVKIQKHGFDLASSFRRSPSGDR